MNAATTTGTDSTSTSSTTVSTQRFVRAAGGVSPFVWRGLLPTLGLAGTMWLALGPFAFNDIETTVSREVRSQLDAKGHGWVRMVISGQDVLLSGNPPRPEAGGEALAVARAATCPTWSGPRVCAVSVLGAFGAPGSKGALPAATPGPAAAVAPQAAPVVSPPAPTAAAAACDAAFAKLLATSRIEFTSGGSTIDTRSALLLDKLAEAARGCPGKVLIAGHTDNVGDAASNLRLSEARAAAVRDALVQRGLPAERLQTAGLGDTKPLADNGNAAGRAANRRIDFRAEP